MKSSDVLVYKGQAFSIEWYFDERGYSPALEYYEGLSDARRIKFLITNGFEKKGQKLPSGEKSRALKAKADFELRIKRGTYYEKAR